MIITKMYEKMYEIHLDYKLCSCEINIFKLNLLFNGQKYKKYT